MKSNTVRIGLQIVTFCGLTFSLLCPSSAQTFMGVQRFSTSRGCEDVRNGAVKGWFGLGTGGPACRADALGDALKASIQYKDFIVDSKKVEFVNPNATSRELTPQSDQHIVEYGIRIANLIDQMAYDFLKERESLERKERSGKPISEAEMKAWILFAKIIAYQETLFSHYQMDENNADDIARLKIAVGDPEYIKDCKDDDDGKKICNLRLDSKGKPIQKTDEQGRLIFKSKGMYQILSGLETDLSKENFDLVMNILNGHEHVYNHWNRILGYKPMVNTKLKENFEKCRGLIFTKNGVNYNNVIRAAYGMYNQGENGICRFAESDKKNAEYEKGGICKVDKVTYKDEEEKAACIAKEMCGSIACPWVNDIRIRNRVASADLSVAVKREKKIKDWEYRTQLDDKARAAKYKNAKGRFEFSFDLDCARDQGRFCLKSATTQEALNEVLRGKVTGKLFTLDYDSFEKGLPEKNFCVYEKAKSNFVCTTQEKLVPCLRNRGGFPLEKIYTRDNRRVVKAYYTLYPLPFNDQRVHPEFIDDPAQLCQGQMDGVFVVGQTVETLKDMPVFAKRDLKSPLLAQLKKGTFKQILDLDINLSTGLDRWYKVEALNKKGQRVEGFIYGGDDIDWDQRLRISSGFQLRPNEIVIPRVGDWITTNGGVSGLVQAVEFVGPDQQIQVKLLQTGGFMPVQLTVGQLRTHFATIRESVSSSIRILGGAQ